MRLKIEPGYEAKMYIEPGHEAKIEPGHEAKNRAWV